MLPQIQDSALLWPGWSSQDIGGDRWLVGCLKRGHHRTAHVEGYLRRRERHRVDPRDRLAGGRLERGGRTFGWEIGGVFRIAAGTIAECCRGVFQVTSRSRPFSTS